MTEEVTKEAKTVQGIVASNKMDKTISVVVERKVKHPIYGKFIRRSKKYLAHDEENQCNEGDVVVIEASRPISKNKTWQLQKVVAKAQIV